ncbi:MAG: hypothetical protein EBR07_04170 [Planctomycetes bacterium]|nr:hypothetical protein [Planctomycetota bacterium]
MLRMNPTCTLTSARTLAYCRVLSFTLASAFLAGCTLNPFIVNYRGDRLTPVLEAQVVQDAPAEGTATEIGSSTFLVSVPQAGDAEAIEAAREVGAGMVKWSCVNAGQIESTEVDSVYQRRAEGRGNFGTYAPIPGQRESWQYKARFWRANSAPAGAPTPPVTTPAGAAPAASTPTPRG